MSDAPDPRPGSFEELRHWLAVGAPGIARPDEALKTLCEGIMAAGVPLYRVGVFVRTLHPNVMGRRFLWRAGEAVSVVEADFDVLESDDYKRSPVHDVTLDGRVVRRRLCDPECPMDYGVLESLREEGVTDYVAFPLTFLDGHHNLVSWTTQAEEGFRDDQLEEIAALMPLLARYTEIFSLRRTAAQLLDTYVGPGAGARILAGQIRRGDNNLIHAVLWLCDLRGFTRMADELRREPLMRVLNDYFGCMVPAIEERGGDVLKFMGDGLLAIFPTSERDRDEARVCGEALMAARDACARVAELNETRRKRGAEELRFGLALHLGEVLYGNIGAANRLDFTAIGPGVNLTARLEKLAGELGRSVVTSAEFAAHAPEPLEPLGRFELRGFRERQEVFGIPAG